MKFSIVKDFYKRYERHISSLSLLIGFTLDNLTLRRIDLWIENLVMLAYLFAAGAIILLLNIYDAGRLRTRIFEKYIHLAPILLQAVFGGLFSVFVVFYSRSASLAASWPFLLTLGALLVGNELFRKRYFRLTFQLSIFFIALYSYSIFAIPVLFGKMGAGVFILSGIASLLLMGFFILIIFWTASAKIKQSRFLPIFSIGAIYFIFHLFYFTNIIPPAPLSIKESGVYHDVKKNNGGYAVLYEPAPWYSFFRESDSTFHWKRGDLIYFYSAVFAPTKINTDILHRWSYFDEQKGGWVIKSNLGFSISGGRDGGYRGYTLKENISPGKWRVDVMTGRGQILGRENFRVIEDDFLPELKTAIH